MLNRSNSEVLHLQELLKNASRSFGLVSATFAVRSGDIDEAVSTGWRGPDKLQRCEPGDRLKIGSITKLITALGVMRLVDKQRLYLDEKAAGILDELRAVETTGLEDVSVAHLLTHKSGIDGDFFEDTGNDDDCLSKYAAACSRLPLLFEPGAEFSYCNAAFPLLARICEVRSGLVWDDFVESEVLKPLGMLTTCIQPPSSSAPNVVKSMRTDTATGRLKEEDFHNARSLAACGATAYASVLDLAVIGLMLTERGLAPSGRRFLSENAVNLMTQKWVNSPSQTFADAWGLGTMHFAFEPARNVIGHDGAVDTFQSMLRADLETGLVVALIAQGDDVRGAFAEISAVVFRQFLGSVPAPVPPEIDFDVEALRRFCGRYATHSAEICVDADESGLTATCSPLDSPDGLVPSLKVLLKPIDETGFRGTLPGASLPTIQRFLGEDIKGRARYFHFRGRTHPRVI